MKIGTRTRPQPAAAISSLRSSMRTHRRKSKSMLPRVRFTDERAPSIRYPTPAEGNGLGHYMLKKSDNGLGTGSARMAVLAVYPGKYTFRVRSTTGAAGNYSAMFEDTNLNGGWTQLPYPE